MKKNIFTNNGNLKEIVKNRMFWFQLNQHLILINANVPRTHTHFQPPYRMIAGRLSHSNPYEFVLMMTCHCVFFEYVHRSFSFFSDSLCLFSLDIMNNENFARAMIQSTLNINLVSWICFSIAFEPNGNLSG